MLREYEIGGFRGVVLRSSILRGFWIEGFRVKTGEGENVFWSGMVRIVVFVELRRVGGYFVYFIEFENF